MASELMASKRRPATGAHQTAPAGRPEPTADAPRELHHKSLDHPDESRVFAHGSGEFVDIAGLVVGRAILEPGWRWSADIKPSVGTPWCELHHFHVVLSGRFAVQMESGEQLELEAGDVVDVPPGHDALGGG